MTIRKNQATLTADEKRRFVDAADRAEAHRPLRRVRHHAQRVHRRRHRQRRTHGPPFTVLPALAPQIPAGVRACAAVGGRHGRTAVLGLDAPTARHASSLWAPDFLGGTGRSRDGRVMDGPFAASSRELADQCARRRPYVSCGARSAAAVRELPTRAEVDSVLAMPTYDMAPWNSASDGFRNHLEGWRGVNLHNRVHVWVGGQMAHRRLAQRPGVLAAPRYIDKLWADWQRRHPGSGYLPAAGTPNVVDLRRDDEAVERHDARRTCWTTPRTTRSTRPDHVDPHGPWVPASDAAEATRTRRTRRPMRGGDR